MRQFVLACGAVIALVALSGCAQTATLTPPRAPIARVSTSASASVTASEAAFYQTQAELLGRVLGMQPTTAWTAPESGPIPTDGSFTARILAVDTSRRTIMMDRIQFFIDQAADEASRKDGGPDSTNSGFYVRDLVHERRVLTVSSNAVAVVYLIDTDWVEGDRSVDTGEMLPVIALDWPSFAHKYQTDSIMRGSLQDVGAVITMLDGKVASLEGNYAP